MCAPQTRSDGATLIVKANSSRFPYVLAVLALTVIALNEPLWAREPSAISGRTISSATSLSDAQRREVQEWARYWCDQMAGGDADAIFRARRELLDPLRRPGLRSIFRDEYSRIAIPMLEEILEANRSKLAAINALQVIGGLGTERALRVAVDYAEPSREPRREVRLWAAQAFRLILEEEAVESRRLVPFVRDISRAATEETDWMVLTRHFESLAAVNTSFARERALMVLEATIERAKRNEQPTDLMKAIRVGILTLRDQFLAVSSEEQREFGRGLGRVLGMAIEVPPTHWAGARQHEDHERTYRGVINMSEQTLRLLDARVRRVEPPRTALEDSWVAGNREQYQRDLDQWKSVLSRSPYGG